MTITSDCPFSEQCDTANCHTEYAKAFLLCRRGFPTMYLGTSCTDFLMHFPLDILYFLILHLVLWYILSWFLCKVWITGLFFFFDGYSIVPVLLKKRPLFLYWTASALLFLKTCTLIIIITIIIMKKPNCSWIWSSISGLFCSIDLYGYLDTCTTLCWLL